MDLVEQGLEAFVFGEPCADLGGAGLSTRSGLAVLLEGEVLAGMEGSAVVTAALRSATAVGVLSGVRSLASGRWWRVS